MSTQRLRLAILASHPIQYFAPLFRALAASKSIDLTVYYCSRHGLDVTIDPEFGQAFSWDVPLLEGYRSVFLRNYGWDEGSGRFASLINPAIIECLRRERHDALIVHGYEHMSKWLAIAGAKIAGTPLFMRGESQLLTPRSPIRRLAKHAVLRPLMRALDGALYLGEENRRFYRHYGLASDRLTHVPYVVDNDFFSARREALRGLRHGIRADFGIPDGVTVVLAAGKLVPKKQPLQLLEAFARVRRRVPAFLLFAGDGPLRDDLTRRAGELGMTESVRVTGFLNQTEIPRAYVAADMLVLASRVEPWGLVVNEAMNFGLPIVATNAVGSATDLIRENENGFIVPWSDYELLADRIEQLVSDADRRAEFGRRSLEIISAWGISRAVDGIVDAISRSPA